MPSTTEVIQALLPYLQSLAGTPGQFYQPARDRTMSTLQRRIALTGEVPNEPKRNKGAVRVVISIPLDS